MSHFSEIVNKKDNRNAIMVSVLALIIILFVLFFMKFHEPDPPIVDVPLPMEMENTEGIEAFEVENGGGGSPVKEDNPSETSSDDPPKEQAQQEESAVSQNSSNGSSSTSSSSSSNQNSNPFGNGSGGNGTAGTGTGFGADNGPGTGSGNPGRGGSGERIRLSDIKSKPTTPNNVSSKISMKLTVNADGRVISVNVIRQNTTTSNEALINEVIALAKKEVKYKAKPGSIQETCYYTVNLSPS